MDDEKNILDYMLQDDNDPPTFFEVVKWKLERVFEIFTNIKYFFQKVFRPYHCSDVELWNLSYHLAKIILPKLKAFKRYPRRGYPAAFVEYFEHEWKNRKEYDAAIKEGKIKGGGEEAWEKALDEMIFAFDFFLNYDYHGNKSETNKMLNRYGLIYPHQKIPENRKVSYAYKNKDGNFMSSPLPPDDPENKENKFLGEEVSYYNFELESKYYDRALEGFKLFGKYFMNLGD